MWMDDAWFSILKHAYSKLVRSSTQATKATAPCLSHRRNASPCPESSEKQSTRKSSEQHYGNYTSVLSVCHVPTGSGNYLNFGTLVNLRNNWPRHAHSRLNSPINVSFLTIRNQLSSPRVISLSHSDSDSSSCLHSGSIAAETTASYSYSDKLQATSKQ